MRLLVTYVAATASNKYLIHIYESEARSAYAADYVNELTRECFRVEPKSVPKGPEGRTARSDAMYELMRECLDAIESKDGKVQSMVQTTPTEPSRLYS